MKEARSRKTIYLVRFAWLEESTSINKSKRKPLDEKEYAFEIKHAEKVMKHRDIKKAEKKKEASRARILAARQEREQSEEDNVDDSQMDEVPPSHGSQQDTNSANDSQNGDESSPKSIQLDFDIRGGLGKKRNQGGVRKRRNVKEKIAAGEKFQQVFECGKLLSDSHLQELAQNALHCEKPESNHLVGNKSCSETAFRKCMLTCDRLQVSNLTSPSWRLKGI